MTWFHFCFIVTTQETMKLQAEKAPSCFCMEVSVDKLAK